MRRLGVTVHAEDAALVVIAVGFARCGESCAPPRDRPTVPAENSSGLLQSARNGARPDRFETSDFAASIQGRRCTQSRRHRPSSRCDVREHRPPARARRSASALPVATSTRPVDSPKSSASGRMPSASSTRAPIRTPAGPREAALGERHGEAAVRDVVRRAHQSRRDAVREQALQAQLVREVDARRQPRFESAPQLQPLAAAEFLARLAEQHDRESRLLEVRTRRGVRRRRAGPPPRSSASGRSRARWSRCRATRSPRSPACRAPPPLRRARGSTPPTPT